MHRYFCNERNEEEADSLFGDGSQFRDFTYVEDIVEGTIRATFDEGSLGQVLNLGTGRRTSIVDAARTVMDAVGKVPLRFAEMPVGDPPGCIADTTRIESLLKWKPSVQLKEGVDRYVQWIGKNPQMIPSWI